MKKINHTAPTKYWCSTNASWIKYLNPLTIYFFLNWNILIAINNANTGIFSISLFKLAYSNHRRRQWHPTPVLLPGKSHGWRSLVGCSPWGLWGSDTTEQLHFHFSLSCIGEGNGNPLQCSCLENPRDRGAWWLPSMGSNRVGHDWSDLA